MPVKTAVEVEEDLKKEYEKKLAVDDRLILDPFKSLHGWLEEDKGMAASNITASKVHSVLTKMKKILKPTGGCVDMWLSCQNIRTFFY